MNLELASALFVVSILLVILGMVLSVGGRIGNTDRHLKTLEDALNKTNVKKKILNTFGILIRNFSRNYETRLQL